MYAVRRAAQVTVSKVKSAQPLRVQKRICAPRGKCCRFESRRLQSSSSAPPLPQSALPVGSPRHKIVTLQDAVRVVQSGDTITCSGFVAQGAPEALLEALGQRYEDTGEPHSLTVFFGGGPGDWDSRGLNHLGKTIADAPTGSQYDMVKRTIGGHYGQVPKLAQLALANKTEAYCVPMGSISRMIRATASHVPGHITTVGIGTFVDPAQSGCKINERARREGPNIVEELDVFGARHLCYKAPVINVAFIRATTADPDGNLSCEHESTLADQRIMAMAARNSGGVVVAQVKRIAALGTIPARQVSVPGVMVDCVVEMPQELHDSKHGQSFFTAYNPAWSQELRTSTDSIPKAPLNERKVVGRRGAMDLIANEVINLGIGMPELIANVCAEEEVLRNVTLTTEVGAIGGLGASGHEFGPAANAYALQEMNQQFDFYNGGGLDAAFLGMAECTPTGDVNVSRLAENKLVGPGGFIDITQCTRKVTFMGTFTAGGLKVDVTPEGIKIVQEGSIKKFVNKTREITFSGEEAVRRGQKITYITERAVFIRSAHHSCIELIEVAPGVDLQKDILDQMEFEPVISPRLKTMDIALFQQQSMNLKRQLFGASHLSLRTNYHPKDHTVFVNLSNIVLANVDDVIEFTSDWEQLIKPLVMDKGPINVVANYDGFDVRVGAETAYWEKVEDLQARLYASVHRFTGHAFRRLTLKNKLQMHDVDEQAMFDEIDTDKNGRLTAADIREGVKSLLGIHLSDTMVKTFMQGKDMIDRKEFGVSLSLMLKSQGREAASNTSYAEEHHYDSDA